MEEKEIWKDIEGYEGYYMVSNMGNVKSLGNGKSRNSNYSKERILKPQKANNGYLQVQLYQDGKRKLYFVHRLVAEVFLDNPEGYTEVNHLDEDKQNNRAENLEYCSRSYNLTYNGRAKKVGKKVAGKLRGRKQSEEHIKKRSKPLFSVDKESGLIMWWQSAREASMQMGINQGNICECCKGNRKSAGGYYWYYADTEQ